MKTIIWNIFVGILIIIAIIGDVQLAIETQEEEQSMIEKISPYNTNSQSIFLEAIKKEGL